jgi:hypothetical protein
MREETRPNIRHTTTIRRCFHQCGKHVTFNYLPALEEVDSDSVLKPEIWCEHSFTPGKSGVCNFEMSRNGFLRKEFEREMC